MFRIVASVFVLCVVVSACQALTCGDGEIESLGELDCDLNISVKKEKSCVCDFKKGFVRGPNGNCISKKDCSSKETTTTTTTTTTTEKPKEDDKKYCAENEELQPMNARDATPQGSSGPYGYPQRPSHYYRHNHGDGGYASPCDDCKYNKCYVCKCKKGFVSKAGKCVKGY